MAIYFLVRKRADYDMRNALDNNIPKYSETKTFVESENMKILRLRAATIVLAIITVLQIAVTPVYGVVKRLRVGFNLHQAPYHFVNEDGLAVGLHIDMLNHIAKSAGYELDFVPMETGTMCMDALEAGEVDIVLDVSQKYPNSAWVSVALSEETVCSVSRIDTENRKTWDRSSVTVYQLGTLTPAISSKLSSNYSILASNQSDALQYLVSGKADILLGIRESVLYYLEDADYSDDYSIDNNYMGIIGFSLIVRENDYSLLRELNYEISKFRSSGEYGNIRKNWDYSRKETNLSWVKPVIVVLVTMVIAFSLYAIAAAYLRRKLQRLVDQQTADLQVANKQIAQNMERIKAESYLRNRIINYSYLGMVLFDSTFTIKLINNSALAISKATQVSSDVRLLHIFGDIVRKCGEQEIFTNALETAQVYAFVQDAVEYRYRFSIQKLPLDQITDILLVVEDITHEAAAQQAEFEQEKSRLLNQLVAGIAHEIKNPLMSIKNFADLVIEQRDNAAFMNDFASYVPSEVERINRLVEGLIGYAKPVKGVIERIDLSTLMWDVVFFAENTIGKKKIRLHTSIAPRQLIWGNQDQIKQVMINIIMNGVESMRDKIKRNPAIPFLTLNISLLDAGEISIIRIRDEGMGMSPEAISHCMDPFFTTKKNGTGLGLTLSKQYTQENNGTLTIRSEREKYTEISITFGRKKYATENSCHR